MLLLINNNYGIYTPQHFAELVEATNGTLGITNLVFTNWDTLKVDLALLADTEYEYYWETWDTILSNATFHLDGRSMVLHQEDDLWLIGADDSIDELFND